jgi:hypothetical protein
MNWSGILSDQFCTWSDSRDKKVHDRLEKAPPSPAAQTSSSHRHSSRLADRTLQALWQARLQMRQGPRSRPQVLPVGKLSPFAPANGLCTPGVSRPDQEVPCQLSARSRDLRGDLRDQSRTTAPSRGALRNRDERNAFSAHRTLRSGIGRRPPGQYARGLARRPSHHRGGDR